MRAGVSLGVDMDHPAPLPHSTLVVVGSGMVSHRLCQTLRELDPARGHRIVVIGEEPRPAYDRVHLTEYFEHNDAGKLLLADREWYEAQGVELRCGVRVTAIDRAAQRVRFDNGEELAYDQLALCTGSAPFVPPIRGTSLPGVFVYRTIEDLDAILAYGQGVRSAAVLGGGLLGLEAARAVQQMGLQTHVVEAAPRLMPRQLDDAAASLLRERIEELGVTVHVAKNVQQLEGESRVTGLSFGDGSDLDVEMVIISAGIRPRDELARSSGIAVGARGGIEVDDQMHTSDPRIFACGEVALHRGMLYGLIAPGYAMADVVAKQLLDRPAEFAGSDMSAKLKLMGVEVASFGDPFTSEPNKTIVFHDVVRGVYKKLVVDAKITRLIGGILVGDAAQYTRLVALARSAEALPEHPEELIIGVAAPAAAGGASDTAQVCVCNNVTGAQIRAGIAGGACTVLALKSCTKAGTGCGACLPLVSDILNEALRAAGTAVKPRLCEHFDYTRPELFQIVAVHGQRTFEALVASHGQGKGCEICKPAVASIFASLHNDPILNHATIQDTNDRFLANIQRGGSYSVVPRVPGGEITPEKLIALGEVAKRYGLYCKITGGQRIDLLGARVGQLPEIWAELIAAGFESGHAYGKALRTVKSCVGSSWCRYGVQDSVGFAIRVEERYKGIRAPHKLKSAVSGCTRECAEAQGKDFGIIATEKGWNLYVCGNGGMKPRHADLLASDLDDDTCIKYIDRFLMFYIRTADRLTRTSVWLDKLEGGIEHLRKVVIDDSLGICAELERQIQHLVDTYQCEWAEVVHNPERRAAFRHFANGPANDPQVEVVEERGQLRPVDWPAAPATPAAPPSAQPKVRLPLLAARRWVALARTADVPRDGGVAVMYGEHELAVFNFATQGTWYATQNRCPHRGDNILARGIVGDQGGVPKVACPLHKKTFALDSGECLSGDPYGISTFPVKVEDGIVYAELPPPEELELGEKPERCDPVAAE